MYGLVALMIGGLVALGGIFAFSSSQSKPVPNATETNAEQAEEPSTSGLGLVTQATIQATTTTLPAPDQAFLSALSPNLRTEISGSAHRPETKLLSDVELIERGRQVCRTTPNGIPPDPAVAFPGRTPAQYLVENEEVTKGTALGERTKLAIKYLCPENQKYLDQALSGKYANMPRDLFGDGTYTVGSGDSLNGIPPGAYESTNTTDCYWERVDSSGRTIENDFVSGAPKVVVVIKPSDAGFVSRGCERWRKVA